MQRAEWQPLPPVGKPSPGALLISVLFHAAVIAVMLNARIPRVQPRETKEDLRAQATILRIGEKLYYAAPIMEAPRPERPPVRQVSKGSPAPAAPAKSLEAPAPAPQAKARAPRVFVPPEVRRNPQSDATLIQPLSPPDLLPEIRPLASFEVRTIQPVRVPPRRFIAPGQPVKQAVEPKPAPELLRPPEIDVVQAAPVERQFDVALALPMAPPPAFDPKATGEGQRERRPGDAVNLLSISGQPVAPGSEILVPPGNAVGRTGEDADLAAGGNRGGAGRGPGADPAMAAVNGPGRGGSGAAGAGSGVNDGKGKGSVAGPADGPGRGGGTAPADSGGGAGAGAGTYTTGPTKPGQIIRRPPNGVFDTVVVQNTPTEQFPESRGLLSGRPIYSVYLSLGTAKDWVLYFCVPGDRGPSQDAGTRVVQLSAAPPVEAPYPVLLERPNVTLPEFFKYVLIHGFVNAEGRFENLRVVRASRPDADRALVASLSKWEFRPATRDGVKIGVEFLLSIPVGGL